MDLVELFGPSTKDYGFEMRFQRGSIAAFFGATASDASQQLLAERRRWLAEAPATYAGLLPEGIPLLEETLTLAQAEGGVGAGLGLVVRKSSPWDRCVALGGIWEPDYLLLQADETVGFRLVAGCVCFPSSWSLGEKLGKPLDWIHSVVPELNQKIGAQIQTFLSRLRPGVAWLRNNWGLSRSPELNQHPERRLPGLDEKVGVDEVWLRVEHQALVSLPLHRGVLFGIRLGIHPLREICARRDMAAGMVRALVTMPEAMAAYKGLATARGRIVSLLGAGE